MVYIIDTSLLITGVIVLVLGIILYIAARYAPAEGGLAKILSLIGLILVVIGVVLIILGLLLPLVSAVIVAPILLGG